MLMSRFSATTIAPITKDNPINDHDRLDLVIFGAIGKRLTFAEVTGKVGETQF
jgi:hypothetical protein